MAAAMPLPNAALRAHVLAPCPSCRGRCLRVWALLTGTLRAVEGEPASSVRWAYDKEELHERVYRIACADCGAVVFEDADCALCGAGAAIARFTEQKNGLQPPPRCPHCDYEELQYTAEVRGYHEYLNGNLSRRVAASEPHEPGFHVSRVDCPGCETQVMGPGIACVACGRSSLLKRLR